MRVLVRNDRVMVTFVLKTADVFIPGAVAIIDPFIHWNRSGILIHFMASIELLDRIAGHHWIVLHRIHFDFPDLADNRRPAGGIHPHQSALPVTRVGARLAIIEVSRSRLHVHAGGRDSAVNVLVIACLFSISIPHDRPYTTSRWAISTISQSMTADIVPT